MEEAPLAVGLGEALTRQVVSGGLEQGGGHPPGGLRWDPPAPGTGPGRALPAFSQFSTKDPSFQLPPRVKPTP